MKDKFSPLSITRLFKWIQEEEKNNTIFGIYKDLFFRPKETDKYRIIKFGKNIDTPFGVAAGPHTQLAQNIITAYLTGSRFIELKTIQILDEINVTKPCISMNDEGYNCEWSQELKLNESFDQYLNAWILIHILNQKYNLGSKDSFIFNISAGYSLKGILSNPVQDFLDKIENCEDEIEKKKDELSKIFPEIDSIFIPSKISDNITISTMHGCPSDEIESIAKYFMNQRKYHTTIKLNPTLLGEEKLNSILNEKLGFGVTVPAEAFAHDLKYNDAISLINNLVKESENAGVEFGIKLTNTLETENLSKILPENEKIVYMSGRPLHPISISLADNLQNEFSGNLNISFSAGIDCFNFPDVIACGFNPITVCSDILKPGGYLRQLQYIDNLSEKMSNSKSIEDYIISQSGDKSLSSKEAALKNLKNYSNVILNNPLHKKSFKEGNSIKILRELTPFDCISAPCTCTCPDNQDIPEYMYYSSQNNFEEAYKKIIQTNPFPNVTGMVCEHTCQTKCTRINYDQPLLIREVKRSIAEIIKSSPILKKRNYSEIKVAIIGGGPSGLALAYFLAIEGLNIEIYEASNSLGGLAKTVIPEFRLSEESLKTDIEAILNLGIKIHFNTKITSEAEYLNNNEVSIEQLKKDFNYIYISTGAKKGKKPNMKGEDIEGVLDAIAFLEDIKNNGILNYKPYNHFIIIGGGNSAIDAARTAKRITGNSGEVLIYYRRTKQEMPADKEEIEAALKEGVKIIELISPLNFSLETDEKIKIQMTRNEFNGLDNSGRQKPVSIANSEFYLTTDKVILALGQESSLDFLKLDYSEINRTTNRIGNSNMFIGGDVLNGASSIISAIADGKKAACEILRLLDIGSIKSDITTSLHYSQQEHQRKSGIRELRKNKTNNFNTQDLNFIFSGQSMTPEDTLKEASRCLLCNEICDVCVSVCPNRANISYSIHPSIFKLPVISNCQIINYKEFCFTQKYQTFNIPDFCNECGNCTTFCPTMGSPFRDKPRLYLDYNSYLKYRDGYIFRKIDTGLNLHSNRNDLNETLYKINDSIKYDNDIISMVLNASDWNVEVLQIHNNYKGTIDLTHLAEMFILYSNLPYTVKEILK